jgi:Ca-activated chloride channel family protein
MSFERPLLLLALLVVPVAVLLYVLAERRRMRYAVRFTNLEVLAAVAATGGGRAWRRYVPPLLLLLALAALVAGLARPQAETMVAQERATVILVIDDSRSMQAKDVRPTRLAAAQTAVRTFLDRVPERLRVGLVVFAGEAHVAAPPTTDRDLVRRSVDEIGFFSGFGGTAIGDALATAVELGQQSTGDGDEPEEGTPPGQVISYRTAAPSPAPADAEGLVSILFLSDGSQTRGLLQPLEGANLAKEAGYRVYTVALGTPEGTVTLPGGFGFGGPGTDPGFIQPPDPNMPTPDPGLGDRTIPVPPDPETLRAIAQTTGGEFSEARTADSLEKVYEKLGSQLGRRPGEREVTHLALAAAAALLVAAGLLSALWSPRLP